MNYLGVSEEILQVIYIINENNTVSLTVVNLPEETTEITLPEYFDNMTIQNISGADEINVSGVSVLKKNAPNMPEKTMEVPYTTTKTGDISLNGNWQWEKSDIPLTVEKIVTATAVYTGEDGNDYKNTTVSVAITRLACTHNGETGIRNKKDATCKEEGCTGDTYCKICEDTIQYGEKIPKSTTRTWDNGKVTKESTATEAGEKTYTCSVCQTTKTEPIAATGETENKGDENGNTENKGDENGNTGNKGDENNNTGNQGSENNDTQLPAKGTTVTDKKTNARYKVTASDKNGATVEYVKPLSKTAKTLVVPATVDVNGVTCKVTSIKKGAFKNNTKLTKITIGSNIKTIGADAFYGCKKLKTITVKTTKLTKKSMGSNAFKGIKSNATFKVPKSKLSAYKKVFTSKVGFVKKTMKIKK